jgi:hypothetical protein
MNVVRLLMVVFIWPLPSHLLILLQLLGERLLKSFSEVSVLFAVRMIELEAT